MIVLDRNAPPNHTVYYVASEILSQLTDVKDLSPELFLQHIELRNNLDHQDFLSTILALDLLLLTGQIEVDQKGRINVH